MGIIGLLLVGLFFSALFSGSETGFYRAGRVRLALDARQGDWIAKALLWLTNNPSLFVATTLIGNNMANYVTSLAIVLAAQVLMGGSNFWAELIAPIVAAPIVFVYGELLPKNIFYLAPNRMLRLAGPVFLVATVIFSPIAVLLWFLGLLLQVLVGESPVQVHQRVARNELKRILIEGHDAGILGSTQSQLAKSVFEVANDPVRRLATPVARFLSVRDSQTKDEVIHLGQRNRAAALIVSSERSGDILGYVRVAEVLFSQGDWRDVTRKLVALRHDESHLTALVSLQSHGESLGEVVDEQGQTIGILSLDELLAPLFRER
jgi:putative hemolysin